MDNRATRTGSGDGNQQFTISSCFICHNECLVPRNSKPPYPLCGGCAEKVFARRMENRLQTVVEYQENQERRDLPEQT